VNWRDLEYNENFTIERAPGYTGSEFIMTDDQGGNYRITDIEQMNFSNNIRALRNPTPEDNRGDWIFEEFDPGPAEEDPTPGPQTPIATEDS